MLNDLHVSHLTGTASIIENRLFKDIVVWDRNARTIGQMFFKPYESKKEFIFCARNTIQPIGLLGLSIISPVALVAASLTVALVTSGFLALSGINACLSNKETASWALNVAEEIFSRVCQTIINLLVLPLSALSMLTRGISTGLKAADVYDYDAPEVPSPLAHI